MINKDALICIGYIKRQHGFKGEIQLNLNKEIALSQGDFVFLMLEGLAIPYPIDRISGKHHEPILKLRFIQDFDAAKSLVGTEVYTDVTEIEEESELTLIGYSLIDEDLGFIGKVLDVHQYPQQVMLEVDHEGKSTLVPLNEEWMQSISAESREIICILPPGLLDL